MTFALWPQWQVPFPQLNVRVTVRNLSHYFSKQMSRFCQRVPDHPKKTLKQQAQWSSGTASLVKTAVNLVRAWKWKRWSETEKNVYLHLVSNSFCLPCHHLYSPPTVISPHFTPLLPPSFKLFPSLCPPALLSGVTWSLHPLSFEQASRRAWA